MIETFEENIKNEIEKVLQEIDKKKLSEAADLIEESEKKGGRVHLTGIGKPSYVAKYVASLFSSTGTTAYFLDGTEAIHGSSGQVKTGDVVIAISNSGETEELIKSCLTLKTNEAYIIGVCKNANTTLARLSKICLPISIKYEGDDLNKPPRISILAQIILLQCLSIILQERKAINQKTYLKWHPGGAIGQSLI